MLSLVSPAGVSMVLINWPLPAIGSLLKIPMGPLYEVYGLSNGIEYHIGTLMLESTLFASHYGDENLFFQHHR